MHLLYKAYACEKLDGDSKILFPGFLANSAMKRPQPGEKIHVELADGTSVSTTIVKTQFMMFDESAKPKLRTAPGFYCAIHVPADFDPPGIELGANIYLCD